MHRFYQHVLSCVRIIHLGCAKNYFSKLKYSCLYLHWSHEEQRRSITFNTNRVSNGYFAGIDLRNLMVYIFSLYIIYYLEFK